MKTKEDKRNFLKLVIFVILIVVIIGFAFARYIMQINGQADLNMAKFSMKVNDCTESSFQIDLAETLEGVTQEVEMRDGFIGPGSAGAFVLEIDGSGSDSSFVYDININVDNGNNTLLPKNLVFYQDSEMENAFAYENNVINIKGFIDYNGESQVQTKTIYWKWKFETGTTESEINANNLADSEWIGQPIEIGINVKGKQGTDDVLANKYQVTFDSNGGALPDYGYAEIASRDVVVGEEYGELPTPVRDGYTFIGWNGKNLFDINNTYSGHIDEQGSFISNGSWISSDFIECELDTDYVFSYKSSKIDYFQGNITFYDNNKNYIINNYVQGWNIGEVTEQSPANAKYLKVAYAISVNSEDAGRYDVQLEEGNMHTEWEPYILLSTTPVTQNKNHTLKAIWEKN